MESPGSLLAQLSDGDDLDTQHVASGYEARIGWTNRQIDEGSLRG